MAELAKALKKLIDNPDDMSSLPQLVAKVEELEGKDFEYQERIQKLQDINKSYLSQIPIPNQDPHHTDDPGEPEPTLEDAKEHIINSLGGNK